MSTIEIQNTAKPAALVIGATGGIGGEVAHALLAAGWRVTGLARNPGEAAQRAGWVGNVEWIEGDAMREAARLHRPGQRRVLRGSWPSFPESLLHDHTPAAKTLQSRPGHARETPARLY